MATRIPKGTKESGIPWIGTIPEHWKIERGKSQFTKMDHLVREEDHVVTCFRDGVVTLRKNRRTSGFTESLKEIGYQGIRKGDLVIHAMDAFAGAIGVSDSDGKGTPVYSVCKPAPEANPYYYAYLLGEMARSEWILALATGIRERSTDFRFSTFANQPYPLPPLAEQAAIVRYLDYMDRRIGRLIRAKQKLIGLLEEQKQAIIHRAVTRGLDPNVPLKPSGVEWLGDIPAHWGFDRGKYVFREVDVRSTTGDEELLSVSHITGVTPRSQKNITMFKSESYVGSKVCCPGQIAVNTMWAWMSAIGVSKYHGIISPSYHVYEQRDSTTYSEEFLDLLLRSAPYKAIFTVNSSGITSSRLRLYPEDFLGIRFLCPPREEQDSLLLWVENSCKDMNVIIDRAQREIELLREYRTRLIADVVTGKIDVREAAAKLPDEPDDIDIPDDLSEVAESMEEELDALPEEAEL